MKTLKDILGKENTIPQYWQHWHGHHNKNGHRAIGKYKLGPGGIDCPCCSIFHPTKLKKKFARWQRRKAKQELNNINTI